MVESVLFLSSCKDSRTPLAELSSRNGCSTPALKVDALSLVPVLHAATYCPARMVVVDEAQFFEHDDLLSFVRGCMDAGKDVVVAGLDSDAEQQPWMPVARLTALATSVRKLTAVCGLCVDGTEASYTIDTCNSATKERPRVGKDGYVAVCYRHMRAHHASSAAPS